jgi:transcriptional/translational regulatory protein YebC/TACO1
MMMLSSTRLTPVKFMFRRRGCITFTIQKLTDSSDEVFGKHLDELIYLCEENGAEDCGPVQFDESADLFQVFGRFIDYRVIQYLFWLPGCLARSSVNPKT